MKASVKEESGNKFVNLLECVILFLRGIKKNICQVVMAAR